MALEGFGHRRGEGYGGSSDEARSWEVPPEFRGSDGDARREEGAPMAADLVGHRRRPWRWGVVRETRRRGEESCGRLGDYKGGSEGLLIAGGRARGGGGEVAHGGRRVHVPAWGAVSADAAKAHGKRREGDEEGEDERQRLTESSKARGRTEKRT